MAKLPAILDRDESGDRLSDESRLGDAEETRGRPIRLEDRARPVGYEVGDRGELEQFVVPRTLCAQLLELALGAWAPSRHYAA
jgi:hypothetical protein